MGKKLTTSEFVKRAREAHGNKYDYSKVEYAGTHKNVCIICPKHGEFWQRPDNHLNGNGCPKCGIENISSTKEEFINKAREVHGDKYDYSKVNYTNNHTKVCIICPEHGEFWQSPDHHLNGNGCPKCAGNVKLDTTEFINKAREVHGDKYDYSKAKYVNSYTNICIICPEHGEFWQRPDSHLNGAGCPKCSIEFTQQTNSSTKEEFINKAREAHGDKYDYSKTNYVNNHTDVCIICPEHGEFLQMPYNHLNGAGCPKCAGNIKLNTNEFIKKAREVHGDKYDYFKVNYVDTHTKICIICPEHGEFLQRPDTHLSGCGCPKCNNSKLESEIRLMLDEQGIKYKCRERKIPWLKGLELDFYIPDKNIAIECQGMQHFKPVEIFGGEEAFKHRIDNDNIKRKLCEENGVRLLYYSNLGIEYPYKVFENKEELLKEIVKCP